MIDEQTDKRPVINTQNVRIPSEKLILPAASPSPDNDITNGHTQHTIAMPSEMQPYYPPTPAQSMQPAPPNYAAHSALPPLGPNVPYRATVTTTWRTDPAYKVLLAAIALVIITGIAFTVYAFNIFAQSTSNAGKIGTATTQKPLKGTTPQGTPNLQPTVPAPGSTAGTPTVGSQPTVSATLVPTPALSPTVPATQPPANGNLTLQITNYPQQVSNNTTVPITIQANKPGASVQLLVTYNAPPGFYGSTIQQSDANGNATLSWRVHALSPTHGNHAVIARVIAVARDQNGHIAQSQMITVQVVN